ncbi:MAG: M16 family metallopeptidase [Mycobacteriales bacterium]
MPKALTLPAPSYDLISHRLANGLRVLLVPDQSVPAVAVAVYYDVGFRSEPEGRTGFAHLFEHLMFQGSTHLAKLDHFRYVQGAGGTFNGSTHPDYTNYFELLPANALERALYLEAYRMLGLALTEDNVSNQVSVVKEEIRVNVLNQPYGGFPWLTLPPVMFDTFPNAHDGYGSFADLEAATVGDAAAFFTAYYAPANAVLVVAGDLDGDRTLAWIEKYFGAIAGGNAAQHGDFGEPDLAAERRDAQADQHAPLPAVAAAWRVPDPVHSYDDYLAHVVLGEVLTDGDASRLQRRLVQRDRTVTQIAAYAGFLGEPFAVRDPTALVLQATHLPTAAADGVLDAIGEEADRVATDGLEAGELDRVAARIAAQLLRGADSVLGRACSVAAFALLHGRPERYAETAGCLAAITEDAVRAAAAAMRPERRAVLELVPDGDKGGRAR